MKEKQYYILCKYHLKSQKEKQDFVKLHNKLKPEIVVYGEQKNEN